MIGALLLALQGTTAEAAAQPARDDAPRSCVLYVLAKDGWAPLRSGPVDREIVPLNSRSPRVPCAEITPQGIGFRLWAGAVPIEGLDRIEVVAVEHSLDEFVVGIENDRWILRPAGLPGDARTGGEAGRSVLPRLARMDGVAVPVHEVLWIAGLDAESPQPTWGICVQSIEAPREHGTERGLRNPSYWLGRSQALRLGTDHSHNVDYDQVITGQARRIESTEPVPLRLASARLSDASTVTWEPWRGEGPAWPIVRAEQAGQDVSAALKLADDLRVGADGGASVELSFEGPPLPPAGHTWTLLVTVWGSGAWPPEGDAPREDTHPHVGLLVDASRDLGVDMVHFEGPDLQLDIRPTMGPGAAWGDVDGDGWVDLFLPQGGGREGSALPTSRFFRNDKGRTFVDESEQRGLALTGAGMGALFYDADGDGDLDLFVANYGTNRFLLNDGKGHFTDASDAVGLTGDAWHAAVSAADYDGDGDLDLYVTSYLRYDTSQMPSDEELGRYQREDPVEMLPFAFPGERKQLLRCDLTPGKDGKPATIRYVDVAKELGLDDPNGRGMQAIWWDFDQDGDQDLCLANDVSPNRFWRNEGGGTFKDVGFSTGLDDPRGSMGLAVGDVDGDLDEDLFVANWQLESNALYVNNLRHTSTKSRVSTFRDNSVEAGLGQLSVGVTSWGCELADFDLDGDLDLFYANGYTSPDYETTGICVGQPCHTFENDGTGKFTPAFEQAGPDAAIPLAARAAVACDFDQDGDLDLVVTANNGRVRMLENRLDPGGRHWLGLRLRGRGANTRAIGAFVTIECGGRKQVRSLRAGTGYLSGNAPELHFGLGAEAGPATCTVRWPSGKVSTHALDAVDRFVTLTEPE